MHKTARQNRQRLLEQLQRPRTAITPVSRKLAYAIAAAAIALITAIAFAIDPTVPGWRKNLPADLVAIFQTITRFGKSDWILYPTGLFLLAAFFVDWGKIAARRRMFWTRVQIAIGFIFLSVAGSGLIVTLLKRIIGRARPVHFADAGSAAFQPLALDASWASFPSGHSTTIAALCTALAMLFPRIAVPALLVALAVGASRVIIGAHYPSDVIAGLLFGSVFTVLMARWMVVRNLAVFNENRTYHLLPRPRHRKTASLQNLKTEGRKSSARQSGQSRSAANSGIAKNRG